MLAVVVFADACILSLLLDEMFSVDDCIALIDATDNLKKKEKKKKVSFQCALGRSSIARKPEVHPKIFKW